MSARTRRLLSPVNRTQPSGSCSLGTRVGNQAACAQAAHSRAACVAVSAWAAAHWGYSTARAVDACAYESVCQDDHSSIFILSRQLSAPEAVSPCTAHPEFPKVWSILHCCAHSARPACTRRTCSQYLDSYSVRRLPICEALQATLASSGRLPAGTSACIP
jgi:hypothetical protein